MQTSEAAKSWLDVTVQLAAGARGSDVVPHQQARKLPTSHAELIDFFMSTETEEMSFEVSRCRPLITEDFFKHLADQICEGPRPTLALQELICMLGPDARSVKVGLTCTASYIRRRGMGFRILSRHVLL